MKFKELMNEEKQILNKFKTEIKYKAIAELLLPYSIYSEIKQVLIVLI